MASDTIKKKPKSTTLKHANVFLVASEDQCVSDRAERLIKRVTSKPSGGRRAAAGRVRLGKVSELAQSFSLDAEPQLISEIKKDAEVRDVILEGEASKIMIKPTKAKRVKLSNLGAKK